MILDTFIYGYLAEIEVNNEDLNISELDSVILNTHEPEEDFWNKWLNFKEYTLFQWVVFGGIILVILICCLCLIYCCLCRASDSTDPYKHVDLQMVNSQSPIPNPYDVSQHILQKSHSEVQWVEC